YVVILDRNTEPDLNFGLDLIRGLETIDLVCTPDLVAIRDKAEAFRLQQLVVEHCENAGDRFAILDSRRGDGSENVWEQWSQIDGKNGAIYYPWIKVRGFNRQIELVPPCGHVAGVYARTDQTRGVHKAPANEVLEGVVALERNLTTQDQADLNSKRI